MRKNPAVTADKVLTDEELTALLAEPNPRWVTGCRNHALLCVMAFAGLRVAEACGLRVRDVRLKGGVPWEIHIVKGKGGKPGVVPVTHRELAASLSRWLARRKEEGVPGQWLFPTLTTGTDSGFGAGKQLKPGDAAVSTNYVRTLVARLARQAGIEKRVTPHSLRHTFCTGLLTHGASLETVRVAARHSDITVTSRYYAHLSTEDVRRAMAATGWGSGE